jgi:hypothetical protein
MNPHRRLYARLTINDKKYDLKSPPGIAELAQRLAAQYRAHKYTGEKLVGILEFSFEPLPNLSILSREQQLEAEFDSMINKDPDNIIFEETGLTNRQLGEIWNDELFQTYQTLCEPEKRIGVDESFIQDIKLRAHEKFDPHLDLISKWRT